MFLSKMPFFRRANYSVVIPTKNSENHIDIILDYYRSIGTRAIVFIDDASADNTLRVCRKQNFHGVETIANAAGVVEAVIEEISKRAPSDWVLRFDDDEIPSKKLMDFADAAIRSDITAKYGFRRLQCCLMQNGLFASSVFDSSDHIQWRLYNRRATKYSDKVHTPGIEVDNPVKAPPEAVFLHLDWIVRSYEERQRKVEHYDRYGANLGSMWRHFYILEENEGNLERLLSVKNREFATISDRLLARFGARPSLA